MRQFFFACFVLISTGNFFAQTGPLEPGGKIPSSYTVPSHYFVDSEIAKRTAAGEVVDIQEQDFMHEMGYYSQQRMLSGLVLFNDSLSAYITKVATVLLKDDPKTLSELHFYAYKSPDPNAFTSATGTILVTVGLLAQLDNEAQLAYILSHEITHYRQHHMLKGYLNREELKKNNDGDNSYGAMSSYYSYNQEQELEADRLGFELYKKSPYTINEALRSFDVLEYANLPFDDVSFDTLFFNHDYMTIPGGYFLTKVDPIYSDDNYQDHNSTHPNVRKRRMALMTEIDIQKDSIVPMDRHLFIVSKESFLKIREMSRYEICRLYLIDRAYPEAIYCSYMMLKRHPNDLYLQKIIGRSLYELASYLQKGNGSGYFDSYDFTGGYYDGGVESGRYSVLNRGGYYRIPDYKDYPGQQQQLFHLFHQLEPDELTVLALSYNWNIHKMDPKDAFQSSLCDSLFQMLVNNQNLHYSYFSTISPDSAKSVLKKDSLQRIAETGETGDSKYSRMDKFRLNDDKARFTKFAYVNTLNDSEFVRKFKYFTDHRTAYVDRGDDDSRYMHKSKAEKKEDAEDDKMYGDAIQKVIVIEPGYEYYVQKKRQDDLEQNYATSEDGQSDLGAVISTEAKNAGVDCVMMNPFNMDSADGSTFSDLSVINEWFYERISHGSQDYVTTLNNQAQIDSLIQKYGTQYVMFTSIESDKYKKIQHPFWYGVSCLAVFPAIYGFIPKNYVSYDNVVLDLKTGKVVSIDHEKKKNGNEWENTSAYYKKIFEKMHRQKKPNTDGKPVTDEERGM